MLTQKDIVSTSDSMMRQGARKHGTMLTQKDIVSTSDSMVRQGARNYGILNISLFRDIERQPISVLTRLTKKKGRDYEKRI